MLILKAHTALAGWRRLPDKALLGLVSLSCAHRGPTLLRGLISMLGKVRAGNLLNTTCHMLPVFKRTNKKCVQVEEQRISKTIP